MVEVLGQSPEPLTEDQVREKCGGDRGMVGKALRVAVTSQTIKRTGAGKKNAPYLYAALIDVARFSFRGETGNEHFPATGGAQ